MKKIEFRGSIAAPQSSLRFGGKIGRVTFEVPQCEIEKAVGLIALQETPLKITVEIDDGEITLNRSKDCAENGSDKEGAQANRKQVKRRTAKRPTDVDSG